MIRKFLLVLVLLPFCCLDNAESQHLIGLSKTEVQRAIRDYYKGFTLDNSTRNTSFKYLKYIDKTNEQTLLCFLSDSDICTSTKLMSDYFNLKETLNDLNTRYKKTNDSTWFYTRNDQKYRVELRKEEWFFSVITREEQ